MQVRNTILQLRDYQNDAVRAAYTHMSEKKTNPCIVIPTGGGKSPVMAQICKDAVTLWGARVILLAHRRELLEQNEDKIKRLAPGVPVGVYSAGLGRRERRASAIVAGIQSVFKRVQELGHFDLAIVDEAHLIPPDGDGMYLQFINDAMAINPNLRVIGLTATPYRMGTGAICAEGNILEEVCYEISVKTLIEQGFLCKLRSKSGTKASLADLGSVHTRCGEFVADELEAAMGEEEIVASAVKETIDLADKENRQKILIFCCGVKHAESVLNRIPGAELVTGETPDEQRSNTLERFKSGDLRFLVNVNVLTEGFDAPNIDMIALMRATKSPGLFYQMCGRGLRLHDGKRDCLVLDFGENVMRHGPIDKIRPAFEKSDGTGEAPCRICPQCQEVILISLATCPSCGFEFPRPEARHKPKASTDPVISEPPVDEWLDVKSVSYSVHTKKYADASDPKTLRVNYSINMMRFVSEWVCVEHEGYARHKAERWWGQRNNLNGSRAPCPETATEAVAIAKTALRTPSRIHVQTASGDFPRVIGYEWASEDSEPPANEETKDSLKELSDFMQSMRVKDEEIPW